MAENPPPPPKRRNWADNLARRSAGLGDTEKAPDRRENDDAAESRRLWKLAGLGLELGATIGIFAYGGYTIDRQLGSGYKATVTAVVIATVGGLYLFIKQAIRANR